MAPSTRPPPKPTVRATGAWRIRTLRAGGARRALGGGAAGGSAFAERLVTSAPLALVSRHQAELPARRGAVAPLEFDLTVHDEAAYVAVVTLASGAIVFAFGAPAGKRRAGRGKGRGKARPARATAGPLTLRFRVQPGSGATAGPAGRRRGAAGAVIRFVIGKVLDTLAGRAIPWLAARWEEAAWKRRGLAPGLRRVRVGADGALALEPVADAPALAGGRGLLFLHGTFSDFQGAFADLFRTQGPGGQGFLEAVRETYGDRLYAFDHFTVSKTPTENARELAEALPAGGADLDVITHSRGALVLRAAAALGPATSRLRLGRAVLVAGPNEGTALASPDRWSSFTTLLANLLDLFPDTPFTLGLDFLAHAVAWLARRVGGEVPGLAAMNPAGPFVRALKGAPPPAGTFSALVASYEPREGLLARLADAGVDRFFGEENDLVVPTAGGWRVGAAPAGTIPSGRVGWFGPEGNLRPGRTGEVHHLNLLRQPESVDFLVRGVLGQPQPLAAPRLPPGADEAGRRGRGPAQARSAQAGGQGGPSSPAPGRAGATAAAGTQGTAASAEGGPSAPRPLGPHTELDEVFHLLVVSPEDAEAAGTGDGDEQVAARRAARSGRSRTALLIASFRNARVIEPFRANQDERFDRIEAFHQRIKGYVDGDPRVRQLPSEEKLREYGALLFDTLFPGQVRRLYDSARSELKDRRLNVCLTSTIGWVAEKPWEFAFDSSRRTFLCTEEVNFIRNSLTAVPADALGPRAGKLRILVVAAQPIGAGELSAADEEAKIRSAFAALEETGLAEVRVEVKVTPRRLHELLTVADVDDQPYDVLHFIGHGEYDVASGFGYLLFEDADGRSQELRADTFRQMVARRDIRLVFLNACETGVGFGERTRPERPFDFSRGVAPMLASGGVPAIVANQFKVLDVAATAFAQHFYWALAVGRTLGDAAREARVAVNYSIAGEAIDWAVPVLFARNPDDRLVSRASSPGAAPAELRAAAVARRRAAGGARRDRVAVWDVNYVLPQLDRMVDRLNAVQRHFLFEPAEIAAPLGTWRRSTSRKRAGAFLYAVEVERKLRPTLASLGVSHLFCVTSMPLHDGKAELSAHSTEDGAISLVSTANALARLSPPETTLERLVANMLAFALAQLDEHQRGAKDCPLYYNDESDIRWNAGALRFCKPCLARLGRGERRAALQALLTAF